MKHTLILFMAICSMQLMAQKPGQKPAARPATQGTKPAATTGKNTQTQGSKESNQTTPSGLQLHLFSKSIGMKPKAGDQITFHIMLRTGSDSVLMNSYSEASPTHGQPIQIQFTPSVSMMDMMEAFQNMGAGDSAVVKVPSDSIFKGEASKQRPPFIPQGSFLKYYIKMIAVSDPNELLKAESGTIEKYIKDNKLNAQKTASGMYYVITQKGSGPMPAPGQKVQVNYSGYLLNGKLFDTSVEEVAKKWKETHPDYQVRPSYQTFEFVLGQGQVIKGWDEGIALLPVGSKAKLIIPSAMGYGNQAAGEIPPNSPLTFDVELVGTK